MEFLIILDIFSIFLLKLKICCQDISKTKSTKQLNFLSNRIINFRNKLPNQIKNSKSVKNFKIKLDDFRKNGKKKNLKGHFGELWMNYFREFDQHIDFVFIVYMFCAKIFFKVNVRR